MMNIVELFLDIVSRIGSVIIDTVRLFIPLPESTFTTRFLLGLVIVSVLVKLGFSQMKLMIAMLLTFIIMFVLLKFMGA